MESLVGYGSDEDNETERYSRNVSSVGYGAGSSRQRNDDNYDTVNMDMSEDSEESEPELPPAKPEPSKSGRDDRKYGVPEPRRDDRARSRDVDRHRDRRDRDKDPRDTREKDPRDRDPRDAREKDPRDKDPRDFRDRDPRERGSREKDSRDRDPRDTRDMNPRDRRHEGSDRDRRGDYGGPRRGLLGDRPEDRPAEKSSSSEPRAHADNPAHSSTHSRDAHDAVSHRFVDRRDRDKDRDRERDRNSRERYGRKSHDRDRGDRSGRGDRHRRSRSRSRPKNAFPPPDHPPSGSGDRRGSPQTEFRTTSYKVNKKLQVMEKMGLQIKTPDGCMKTAQQLRADTGECVSQPALNINRPSYYNPAGTAANVLEQVKKRKLLWANKGKSESEEAAKWSGTRFAADQDGKQVNKFMRLMGIKDGAAVSKPEEAPESDPIKKQEELFQAMQAQYEVARATTHTMRGVGLGFQRGQF